jgi:flagellar biosynthetic protein FlhB
MAEEQDQQDRTLEPSGKRLEDARSEGQVPRSRDLVHLFVIGSAVAVLAWAGGGIARGSRVLMEQGLRFDAASAMEPGRMTQRLADATFGGLAAVAPALAALVVAAFAAPLLIGGWLFSPNVVQPRFSRIDPVSGFGRLLSLQSLVGLGKTMLLALLLATVGGSFILTHMEQFAALASGALGPAMQRLCALVLSAFALLAMTLAVVAAIDVPYQIWQFRKRLRMTVQEARQEERELQGDPRLKAQVRKVQREMARRRMMAAVPKADVVVTNPTHFAVALKYLEGRHRAPMVVAKGMDEVAARIRDLARENGVPQLEAPPLARALYKHVEVGDEVPAALYTAVAQVLAYVFQLRSHGQGLAPRPVEPHDIEIPEGLDPLAPRATA